MITSLPLRAAVRPNGLARGKDSACVSHALSPRCHYYTLCKQPERLSESDVLKKQFSSSFTVLGNFRQTTFPNAHPIHFLFLYSVSFM